jgi:hypothetical protein
MHVQHGAMSALLEEDVEVDCQKRIGGQANKAVA